MATDFVQMSLLDWGGICAGLPEPVEPTASATADPDQEFTDGITPDRFETFEVAQIKKFKDTCKISLAQGDSGKWYCGWDAWCAKAQHGTGFAAWPKFSDAYDTKYQAFEEAMLKAEYWLIEQGAKLESTNSIRCHLKTFLRDIDPVQYHRDSVCGEWRHCGYAEQCFAPDNDGGEDPVCFKVQHTNKAKQAADQSLADLCQSCHAASFCAGCCVTCKEPCHAAQHCRWPGAELTAAA